MMTIETKIDPCELDGKDVTGLPDKTNQVIVRKHWNMNTLVVIEYQGRSFTVDAKQLRCAISNAINF